MGKGKAETRAGTVVGVDVGGPRKGFHAIALSGSRIHASLRTPVAAELAAWCRAHDAQAVAVDAPCRWRPPGGPGRLAERELAREGMACFPTPTRERAAGHPFFQWMLGGAEVFAALERFYPLYAGRSHEGPVCFETFPQAVACALAGGIVSAKEKRPVRTALLQRAGINVAALATIDEIDATLCALAAQRFTEGSFKAYGEAATGYLIVPASP